MGITAFGLVVSVALPAAAQRTTESTTLFVCQKQAGAQAGRYAFVRQRLLGACLGRVAADAILQNETPLDVERSARGCLGPLYALGRTDGRAQRDIMTDRVNRFCDPSEAFPQHSEDDVLGTGSPGVNQPLDAATLDGYCGSLATGASTLAEWVECMRAAAECTAHQQIVSEYPRVLEWLNLVDAELASSTHPFAAEARAELQAVEAAIDGASDDDSPDIACGPGGGLVVGVDPILPATGQTTSFGAGSDGDVQAGQARSFTDNGDGTITDNATGLMWEKKEDFDDSSVRVLAGDLWRVRYGLLGVVQPDGHGHLQLHRLVVLLVVLYAAELPGHPLDHRLRRRRQLQRRQELQQLRSCRARRLMIDHSMI